MLTIPFVILVANLQNAKPKDEKQNGNTLPKTTIVCSNSLYKA